MAYLDLSAVHPFEAVAAAPEVGLSPQERLVVVLSRRDPLWSLQPLKRRSRFLRWLFGIDAPHRLADGRLEALRRYAVSYRLLGGAAPDVDQAARNAGFAPSQLAQLRTMVDAVAPAAQAGRVPSSRQQALLALSAVLIVAGAAAWLSPHLG